MRGLNFQNVEKHVFGRGEDNEKRDQPITQIRSTRPEKKNLLNSVAKVISIVGKYSPSDLPGEGVVGRNC